MVEAFIVRTMKLRKSMMFKTLGKLTSESLPFQVSPHNFKTVLQSLILRDYLERDAANQLTYIA
jgi:hypothetical protein